MTALYWIVAAVALQRLGEVAHARRNAARLMARGGVESGAGHYPLMVALHAAWLLAIVIVVPADRAVDWAMLAIYGILQVLRYWTIASLGPSAPCLWWASAQPRKIVPHAKQNGNPCSVERAMAASARSWPACPSRRN